MNTPRRPPELVVLVSNQRGPEPRADEDTLLRDAYAEVLRASEAIVDGERDLAYAILTRLEENLACELARRERTA